MKKERRVLRSLGVLVVAGTLTLLAADFEQYQRFFGLDPVSADGALQADPDSDALSNQQEFIPGTDPLAPDTDRDGWPDNVDSNALSRAVFLWGHPQFTSGDRYLYTFPEWVDCGFNLGGSWSSEGWTAGAALPADTGSLNLQMLRDLLPASVVLDIDLQDSANASLYVALCDTNQQVLVQNLYGQNLLSGSQQRITRRLTIPFSAYPAAASVRLQRGTGEIAIYRCLMYIDQDGDGLDAEQEEQAGTSDTNPDCDGDGLTDWTELFLTHTNPLVADTDRDGLSDGDEIRLHRTSPLLADSDADGLADGWEVSNGLNPLDSADSLSDPDGDGIPTLFEFHRGCGWNDALDFPAITARITPDQKIQDIINASGDYAVLFIEPGVYSGWKNQNLQFNGRSMMLQAAPGTVVLDTVGAQAIRVTGAGTAVRTVLDGLTIRNASQTALFFKNSGVLVRNCTIENCGSASSSGGALSISGGPAWIENSFLIGNLATNGGAIYAQNANVQLRNCTLFSNQVTGVGGALRAGGASNALTIVNSILWEEQTAPISIGKGVRGVTVAHSCVRGGYAGTNNLSADPLFAADGRSLRLDSPCMDAGSTNAPARDFAGHARTALPDLGALEYLPAFTDSDGDGHPDAAEAGISNPLDINSLPVSSVAITGTVSYVGLQTGPVCLTVGPDGNAVAERQLSAPGDYAFSSLPTLVAGRLTAWVDSNGNGLRDASEAVARSELMTLRHDLALNLTLTDPDADGDGLCDALEQSGTLYLRIPGLFTWEEAKADAERLGGRLAAITSEQEHRVFCAMLGATTSSNRYSWIGAEDLDANGEWVWITSEPFAYARWMEGPLLPGAAVLRIDEETEAAQWVSAYAKARFGYLLELPVATRSDLADSDGDGVNDLSEIHAGSHPLLTDTDGDGLSDAQELAARLLPSQPDSDFDGLSDPQEIALGTGPLNSDSDGDGLLDGMETSGRHYQIVFESMKWSEANAHAIVLGGQLAVIDSVEKQQEIRRFLQIQPFGTNYPASFSLFIGATGDAQRDQWSWINGAPWGDAPWAADYPMVTSDGKYAAIRTDSSSEWIDVGSDEYRPALVEFANSTLNPLNPDSDGDGLLDGEEIALGMNPCGLDSDGDGLSDALEKQAGLNGGVQDSDADGLTDADEQTRGTNPLKADSDGDGLLDGEEVYTTLTDPLVSSPWTPAVTVDGAQAVNRFRSHYYVEYLEDGADLIILSLLDSPHATWRIQVPEAGMYRLALQLESYGTVDFDYRRYPVEIRINGHRMGETLAVTNRGALAEGVVYTPWLQPGTYEVECTFKRFTRTTRHVRIHALELGTVAGADADGNGLADWIDARMGPGIDSDGDGLSDRDEISIHGTSSLSADTDGDGLKDDAELALGTDPRNSDSDGDGVNDGTESQELSTDALNPEFDGTVVDLLTLPGSATNCATGLWKSEGTAIRSAGRRGELGYRFSLPLQEMVRLEVDVTHGTKKLQGAPDAVAASSALDFYVDGLYIGSRELLSASDGRALAQIFLPRLTPGEHALTVFWENLDQSLVLDVKELRFQQLGGPDANGDGVKDWIQASLNAQCSVDFPSSLTPNASRLISCVSPLCLEGAARYPELASIATPSAPCAMLQRAAGARWYANVPLNETGKTALTVSFENGAFTRTVLADWVAYNLIAHNGETLTIRKGDQVKFVALPEGAHGGQFDVEVVVDVNGEVTRSPNTAPIIRSFPEAGTFTVSGTYTHGNDTLTASVQVRVVDWTFTGAEPACPLGSEREWTINLPQGAVLEADPTIQMELLGSSPTTNNEYQITASLLASEVNGDHRIVARLFAGGPILGTVKVNPFWIIPNADPYMAVVARYEDCELWQAVMVQKHLPPGMDIVIDVFATGVLLDDYTVTRRLTVGDFNAAGEYLIRLFHPNEREGSTCFKIETQQEGQFVGIAR